MCGLDATHVRKVFAGGIAGPLDALQSVHI
jgi:hypothetical protein